MAQYGTKHGHAMGKLDAMLASPRVEVTGVYEPDQERRSQLAAEMAARGGVRWYGDEADLLSDTSVVAVAAEGRNDESLPQVERLVDAGKHVWYDKPAGEDWPRWQAVVAAAERRELLIQMGYMFRYHAGFQQIHAWARSGLLGELFAVRAHMSTWIDEAQRVTIGRHRGGIFFDLGGHMLDQVVWLLGRPERVTSFLRQDGAALGAAPHSLSDNTVVVLEYEHAQAIVDIAAMESPPAARRFEVYGTEGSAIIEPFEPEPSLRLCLGSDPSGAGAQHVPLAPQPRQVQYERELQAFLDTIDGKQAADRPVAHELLVQETLLRATGAI